MSLPTSPNRCLLLASTALIMCAAAMASDAGAASVTTSREDLGALDAATPITATVWLKPHDQAAFDADVAARMTPGSASYHHWMTAEETASYNATSKEVGELLTALRTFGLQVVRRENDNSSIQVQGTAAGMQVAFGTGFRTFAQQGRHFYVNTSEPHFAGKRADLIAGITGLSNEPAMPYVLRQIDLSTNKPVSGIPTGTIQNPDTTFTANCFKALATTTLVHFEPNGRTGHGDFVGPQYTTRSLPGSGFKTCGYTAGEVASQYGLPAVYAEGFRGQGQTIVIVDAYGSPTIRTDANTFSSMMGLPALTSANLQVVYPDGPPIASPYKTSWPEEVSLDVEWAHAMAPMARIVLVVAPSDDLTELAYAVQYAVAKRLGGVVSNSYGSAESGVGPAVARAFNMVIERAAAQGIAVNVATGDSGDFGLGTPVGAASIPADSPYATAIGGTSLNVPSDNGPVDAAWGNDVTFLGDQNAVAVPPQIDGFIGGSGGGQSLYLEKPRWQARAGLPGVGRQLPDISAIADPQTGGIIVADRGDGQASVILTVGGTSLATPVFSGIWALAEQAAHERLGQAGPVIAAMPSSAVTDIVPIEASLSNLSGTVSQLSNVTHYTAAELLGLAAKQPNGFVGVAAVVGRGSTLDIGFGADSSLMAAPGWDTATGFGEPNGLPFINAARAAASRK